MVGHTGDFSAAVRAVEAVDTGVGAVVSAIRAAGGVALITADHGNAEDDGGLRREDPVHRSHTLGCAVLVCATGVRGLRQGGKLADVAPTLLELIGVAVPEEWTGRSLLIY